MGDELAANQLDRLKHALGVAIGTDALITACDVLQLDDETAHARNPSSCRLLTRTARKEEAERRAGRR